MVQNLRPKTDRSLLRTKSLASQLNWSCGDVYIYIYSLCHFSVVNVFRFSFYNKLGANSCTAVNRLNRTENYVLPNRIDTSVLQANVFLSALRRSVVLKI